MRGTGWDRNDDRAVPPMVHREKGTTLDDLELYLQCATHDPDFAEGATRALRRGLITLTEWRHDVARRYIRVAADVRRAELNAHHDWTLALVVAGGDVTRVPRILDRITLERKLKAEWQASREQ